MHFFKKRWANKTHHLLSLGRLGGLLLALTTLASCEKIGFCRDRQLQLERQNYTGTRLRTAGYYSCPVDTDDNGLILNEIIILYRNGVTLYPGKVSAGNEELYLHAISGSPDLRQSKPAWGIFNIQDSLISISKWQSAQCGFPAVLHTGEVMNDTTFVLRNKDIKGKFGTGTIPTEQYYRYHPYFPKPDSINDFISAQ